MPEVLIPALDELAEAWAELRVDPGFRGELAALSRDFVGRPTPITYAGRLSAQLGYEIWLKREDLAHTGAHKINNALGQALLARRLGKERIIAETGAGSTAWRPPPPARCWACRAWCTWARRTPTVRRRTSRA